ncbi:ankyrin repeat domain-containing protein [Helicobacter sp. MIT 99-5507]|nr:ankyrin repeat domain-containing protein [Helicobacter sp. MIT 99-5507]
MKINAEEEQKLEELCALAFDFARENDIASISTLIQYGLNVDLANHKGNTLLMLAAYNNSLDVAELLLKNGASVDKKNDKAQTPLAGVVFKGYIDMTKLLLKYGANPNEDNGMGLTPINCAIMFRRKEILDLLLKHTDKKLSFLQKIGFFIMHKFIKPKS